MLTVVYCISFFSVAIAIAFAVYLHLWVKKQPVQNQTILNVSGLIKEGANTFMRKEYTMLAIFALVASLMSAIFVACSLFH